MTPITPSTSEILVLWRLAVDGGEAWSKDVKPELKRETRERLAAAGLIEAEKRLAPSGRSPIHLTLSDGGWAWIAANLDVELTTRSPAASEVFSRLIRVLGRYMRAADVSLAELLAPAPAAVASPSSDGDGDLAARVASAYYALSEGRPNVRVRLSDLRRRLVDVPRETLDRQLLKLDSSGAATLIRLDDPREIDSDDREAVLLTPAGEERHGVYLEGLKS